MYLVIFSCLEVANCLVVHDSSKDDFQDLLCWAVLLHILTEENHSVATI